MEQRVAALVMKRCLSRVGRHESDAFYEGIDIQKENERINALLRDAIEDAETLQLRIKNGFAAPFLPRVGPSCRALITGLCSRDASSRPTAEMVLDWEWVVYWCKPVGGAERPVQPIYLTHPFLAPPPVLCHGASTARHA